MYFKHVRNWETYFLADVPPELKQKLGLAKVDLGIDLVAVGPKGYYCIQAKYRKFNQKKKTVLGWKTLSTFYALAQRTGPWQKHIVITNADYIRHAGKKTETDWSICIGTLRGIKRHQWEQMVGNEGKQITITKTKLLSPEEVRKRRLAIFNQ